MGGSDALKAEISTFFIRSTHASPDVVRGIQDDIQHSAQTYGLLLSTATWGSTQQERLCLYGGLPINSKGSARNLPVQVWFTHYYPIDPPSIFVVGVALTLTEMGEVAVDPQVIAGHPNVDHTGLCYCAALANWTPATSQLSDVLASLINEINENGYPLCLQSSNVTPPYSFPLVSGRTASPHDDTLCVVCCAARDAVCVPCGHWCCCYSCLVNLPVCPICRVPIHLRQVVVPV